MKLKNTFKYTIIIFFITIIIATSVVARIEDVDLHALKLVAIPLHIIELLLSIFICFMAIKFFRITRPLNLFLFIYVAVGFFMINSLLNLLFYLAQNKINTSFVNVHIGSRIALIGMLVSFVMFFYNWNRIMRKKSNVK